MERTPRVLALFGVFAGYIALSWFAIKLGGPTWASLPFRPASGLAFAALVALGVRAWPAVYSASFLVAFFHSRDVITAMLIASGLTVGAVLAALFVSRFAKGLDVFRSIRTTLPAVGIVVGAALLPAAAIAVSTAWRGLTADPGSALLRAWFGQATGILVAAPCLILLVISRAPAITRERVPILVEVAALFTTAALVGAVVFAGFHPAQTKTYSLEFLSLPVLLWASFRFGPREVALTVAMLSSFAVWGTTRGLGPFADVGPAEAVMLLQAYILVLAITGIAFATTMEERRQAEAQLKELATTDPLTGLVNYRRLLDVLRHEIARSRRTKRPFAVLLVDMDGLKRINDQYGHLAGSRALCRVAQVLKKATRETDVVSRFGGDEFAVVLPESADEGGPAVLARVSERLAQDRESPQLTVSGGHAIFPRDGDSATILLRAADRRMYEAKNGAGARSIA
jgi:diguanylate cyclase (GGDEF)-like protein